MPKRKGGIAHKAAHMRGRKTIGSTWEDPYLSKEAPADMAVCRRCGAVYHEKRWVLKDELPAKLKAAPYAEEVFCPGCQKVRDGYPEGFLTIEGEFVKAHRDEIMELLRNKAAKVRSINPLEAIIEIKTDGGHIEVTTTTEKFAQKIAQFMEKAFNGEVEYKWSHENTRLGRFIWRRNDLS